MLLSSLTVAQIQGEKPEITYITSWGEKGREPGLLQAPHDLSIDPRGYVYIADTENQRIQKFSTQGQFVTEIGGFGWEKEQFDWPSGICAKNGLDVLVADYNNQRIERYDKDLHYLASLKSRDEWPENLQFGFPVDVDLSSQGELFCIDGENQRILKLDILGTPQLSFGDFDQGEGRLVEPVCLWVASNDRVYVTDQREGKVIVFDIHGNYLFSFGEDRLVSPASICTIPDRFVLVTDQHIPNIFIFHELGGYVSDFKSQGIEHPPIMDPVSIAYWRDTIYILDRDQCQLHLFHWQIIED
jgi:DNA-binding beta-propeller fold protein YncE